MLRPSRILVCTGDLQRSVEIIVGAFTADGFKRASEAGQFPVRLKSGSAFLVLISNNEFLVLLWASRAFRKRALPVDVLIHHEQTREGGAELLVEMRPRGGSGGHFAPTRFENLLSGALDQLRAEGKLRSVGDLQDAAGRGD